MASLSSAPIPSAHWTPAPSLEIAQDSGNRFTESIPAIGLARTEAERGDTASAFDHLALAIRNYQNSGNTANVSSPLAVLAALFDRLGRYEPAATIAGFAFNPLSAAFPELTTAIAHLREVLGEHTYESLACQGEAMSTAAMATYGYDQIDHAPAALTTVSE